MKADIFKKKIEPRIRSFEGILNAIDKKKKNDVGLFPRLYRRICHDLNLAKSYNLDVQLTERLNQLAFRGHQRLYKPRPFSFGDFARFWLYDFPQAVRREIKLVLITLLLFYGTGLGIFVLVRNNPEIVYSITDRATVENLESMYDPDSDHFLRNRPDMTNAEMFSFYIFNNLSIGFRVFAGGVLVGLGSIFFLLLNSIFMGAIAAHIVNIGFEDTFFRFVVGHSGLELTAFIMAAVSGLKLGWSIVSPGRETRVHSLKAAAQRAIPMVYGSTGMLVLAAIIEAFWSARVMLPTIKYAVGAFLWALIFLYFLIGGRMREA